ncbi:hypothetical protein QBC45DRAFT_446777 [Copromyces sp. CBS 386.78]|nr:hypothetical protein QBC45DRAFT_446777 [Copromyces sp. CBS 386.78]
MTADDESLTLWDKISLAWLVLLFGHHPLHPNIQFLIFQRNPSLHWRQNLALAYLKISRATFSAKYLHLQARCTPTGQAIESYMAKKKHPNIAHTTVTVPLPSPPSSCSDPQLQNLVVPDLILHLLTPVLCPVNRGNGSGDTHTETPHSYTSTAEATSTPSAQRDWDTCPS